MAIRHADCEHFIGDVSHPLSYTKPRQSHVLFVSSIAYHVVYANLLFLTRGWVANKHYQRILACGGFMDCCF